MQQKLPRTWEGKCHRNATNSVLWGVQWYSPLCCTCIWNCFLALYFDKAWALSWGKSMNWWLVLLLHPLNDVWLFQPKFQRPNPPSEFLHSLVRIHPYDEKEVGGPTFHEHACGYGFYVWRNSALCACVMGSKTHVLWQINAILQHRCQACL